MSAKKQRLTVTVDPELVEAGQRAVESGEAESVSSWVSIALEEKLRRDHKLRLLAAAVADFEGEFGEITHRRLVGRPRAWPRPSSGRTDRPTAVPPCSEMTEHRHTRADLDAPTQRFFVLVTQPRESGFSAVFFVFQSSGERVAQRTDRQAVLTGRGGVECRNVTETRIADP